MLETAKKIAKHFTGQRVVILVLLLLVLLSGVGMLSRYTVGAFLSGYQQLQQDVAANRDEVAAGKSQVRENQALWSRLLATNKKTVANEIELRVLREQLKSTNRSITLNLPTLRVTVQNGSDAAGPYLLEPPAAEVFRSIAPEPTLVPEEPTELDALREQQPADFRQEAMKQFPTF